MIRELGAICFAFLMVGCRNSGDSSIASLSGSLKPEGFLVIKEIVADPAKSGSFLVTCASSSGEKKSSVSQADIEANKVCLPTTAMSSTGGSPAGTQPESSTGAKTSSGFEAKNLQSSYLKARPGLDVTGNLSTLKLGIDYCVVMEPISATNICSSSEKELKATGVKLAGCDLTSGYLFAQHFSVTPVVSACR